MTSTLEKISILSEVDVDSQYHAGGGNGPIPRSVFEPGVGRREKRWLIHASSFPLGHAVPFDGWTHQHERESLLASNSTPEHA